MTATDFMSIWKPIPGYPGYEVSSCGRVRSHWWYVSGQGRGAREYREDEGWELKQAEGHSGHLRVFLGRGSSRGWQFVHRLVLLAFIGPCPNGMCCCHCNGNPADNRLKNLRWDTYSENQKDSVRHGTHDPKRGSIQSHSKLTERLVREILASSDQVSASKWAAKIGCSKSLITSVRRGESWGWVSR